MLVAVKALDHTLLYMFRTLQAHFSYTSVVYSGHKQPRGKRTGVTRFFELLAVIHRVT